MISDALNVSPAAASDWMPVPNQIRDRLASLQRKALSSPLGSRPSNDALRQIALISARLCERLFQVNLGPRRLVFRNGYAEVQRPPAQGEGSAP
jgi:hypothetical protein